MWIIYVLLILIFVPVLYVLFAPFYIEVNTETGLYRCRFHRLASAQVRSENDSLVMEMKVGWWVKKFDLLEQSHKTVQIKKPARQKNKPVSFKTFRSLLKTFIVKKCIVSIDSGSMPLNGLLYPVFYWVGIFTGKSVSINFFGENRIIIQIRNSFFRLGRAYIRSVIKI
jgi:hypothetical protein